LLILTLAVSISFFLKNFSKTFPKLFVDFLFKIRYLAFLGYFGCHKIKPIQTSWLEFQPLLPLCPGSLCEAALGKGHRALSLDAFIFKKHSFRQGKIWKRKSGGSGARAFCLQKPKPAF
jgi:hypothetical protein